MRAWAERSASSGTYMFPVLALVTIALAFCVLDHRSAASSIVGALAAVAIAAFNGVYGYFSSQLRLGILGVVLGLFAAVADLTTSVWGLGHALFQYHLPIEGPAGGGILPMLLQLAGFGSSMWILYRIDGRWRKSERLPAAAIDRAEEPEELRRSA